MSTTKKLAWAQIVIMSISSSISFYSLFATKTFGFSFFIGDYFPTYITGYIIGSFLLPVIMVVLGIAQVIHGAKDKDDSQKGYGAGIMGMLSIIPFVKYIALVMNILVIADNN